MSGKFWKIPHVDKGQEDKLVGCPIDGNAWIHEDLQKVSINFFGVIFDNVDKLNIEVGGGVEYHMRKVVPEQEEGDYQLFKRTS